jgi:hypothetical protein
MMMPRPTDRPHITFVPAGPSAARVRALHEDDGYSYSAIARATGCSLGAIIGVSRQERVTTTTEAKILAVTDDALADAVRTCHGRNTHRLWPEDLELLADDGATTASAAERFGVQRESIRRACVDRWGRPDLWRRLRANESRAA